MTFITTLIIFNVLLHDKVVVGICIYMFSIWQSLQSTCHVSRVCRAKMENRKAVFFSSDLGIVPFDQNKDISIYIGA